MKPPKLIALDTNVWLRYLLNDDEVQSPRAKAVLQNGLRSKARLLLPVTVVLEVAWVLRSKGANADAVALGLKTLLGLPSVEAPEHDALVLAISWSEQGMDFADALHLALSTTADEFRTFDERFAKAAARGKATPQVMLVG